MNQQHQHFDLERINNISIVDVAKRLGSVRKTGSLYLTLCPWHDDSNPSLVLYHRTNENHCHCYACGKSGSVISFVMQHEGWTFVEACQWLSNEYGISTTSARGYWLRPKPKPVERAVASGFTYIPTQMVDELVSAENSLCQCLMQMFRPEAVGWITEEYRIGCYTMNGHDNCTVFPSIDKHDRVCNLKVQHYDTDPQSPRFAHCTPHSCFWLGSIWMREGRLPKEARLSSTCMFGEHLLNRYPESVVALVESPKNALFGALAFPRFTWIATGNKAMLRREVLQPLRGRNVIVIPDRDAISEWRAKICQMADLANFTVFDICEQKAPEGALKFDIADYLQQQRHVPP